MATIDNRNKRIVIAIDSFKGCLSSKEANQAAAEGVRRACPDAEIVQVPVSDGGEGFLEAFHAAVGGTLVEVMVRDPLMRPVIAKYLLCEQVAIGREEMKPVSLPNCEKARTEGRVAVIEMAQASGLTLLSNEERNPMVATSYGTGQLVADAVRKGAGHIIVGLGGSATSDAGIGMLRALKDTFAKNGFWDDIEELKHVRFTIASDVKNPLCGENGAAYVFAPQKFAVVPTSYCGQTPPDTKGATPEKLWQLDERARKFAEVSARHFGYDRSGQEGAGAAGGLGYAFLQYLDAACKPGIQLLLETVSFSEIVRDADLIITGEGSADRQTLMGKLPMGILQQSGGAPVCLIAGRTSDCEELLKAGFSFVECINPEGLSLEEAMRKDVAMKNVGDTLFHLVHQFLALAEVEDVL